MASDMKERVAKAMLNELSELEGDNYTFDGYFKIVYLALASVAIKEIEAGK